jgi:hypothetical protein
VKASHLTPAPRGRYPGPDRDEGVTVRGRRATGLWPGAALLGCAALLALLSESCAHPGPALPVDDVCDLLAARADWYETAAEAGARWDVPPGVLLAVIHQESRFRPRARPWWRIFGLPVAPASSAYGFGQATDGTWRDYLRATGRRSARRDDFADAVDFIGWYADVIHRTTQVPKDDAYHLYLAYHEGPGGFVRRSYEGKDWLLSVARRVAERAARFDRETAPCAPPGPQIAAPATRG